MDPEFARFQAYHLVIDDRKEYNNKYKKQVSHLLQKEGIVHG